MQSFTRAQIASPSIFRFFFGIAWRFRQKFSFLSGFFRRASHRPVLISVATIFRTRRPRSGIPIWTREPIANLLDGGSVLFAFRIVDRKSFSVRQNLMAIDDPILFPEFPTSRRTRFPFASEPSEKKSQNSLKDLRKHKHNESFSKSQRGRSRFRPFIKYSKMI